MDAPVQQQVRERFAAMQQTIARQGATDTERGQAYGGMGMTLHASEYFDAAEPAYLNAQRLMPREPRWPTSSRICTRAGGTPPGPSRRSGVCSRSRPMTSRH